MAEHTPGPWSVSGFDTTTVIAVKDGPNRKGQEFVDGRHQYTIARPGDVPDIYERAANARLIAAAPALLEALKEAIENCLQCGGTRELPLVDEEGEPTGETALCQQCHRWSTVIEQAQERETE